MPVEYKIQASTLHTGNALIIPLPFREKNIQKVTVTFQELCDFAYKNSCTADHFTRRFYFVCFENSQNPEEQVLTEPELRNILEPQNTS